MTCRLVTDPLWTGSFAQATAREEPNHRDEATRLATKRQEAREAAARAQREHRERKASGGPLPPVKLPSFAPGATANPPAAPGATMSDGNGRHTVYFTADQRINCRLLPYHACGSF